MQFWKFFKEERADSTPLKDIKPVEPEFELERPGILNYYLQATQLRAAAPRLPTPGPLLLPQPSAGFDVINRRPPAVT